MPEPTNPRRHQAETERNLLIGAVILLLVVGGGLIAALYGRGAGVLGLVCIAGGVGLLLTLFLLLKLFERLGGD
jgi:hypothetical protein